MEYEKNFIKKIRKQLFPYRPEKDVETQSVKWDVSPEEYITSWVKLSLINCRKANGCDKDGRCRFFGYTDLAKNNFNICREMILRLENGGIICKLNEEKQKD
ncbi:hypothetical protein J7M07_03425 [bacterium]|nr:hypothetical protein [bacterium]